MSKVKTLRELTCNKRKGPEASTCPNCDTNHTFTEELLKIEAIKWINHLQKIFDKGRYEEHYCCQIDWIKKFFNITKEDLKNGDLA